ncbi:DNA gyrase inhibitor YacG [Rhodospirillaceae bacterium SYSU D60014]|uniref:DNA gyrase inhibitor YacG n=1 Tax=Virgifigura deserti TaxID=2268457 RepID=UPI000E66625E
MAKIEDLAARRAAVRGNAGTTGRARKARGCPICGEPMMEKYRPFCSRRCADIDLGRWLKEGYHIPAEETPDSDGDATERDD